MDEAAGEGGGPLRCPACAADLEPGARFCTVCGTDLEVATADLRDEPVAERRDVTTVLDTSALASSATTARSTGSSSTAAPPSTPATTGTRCRSCGAENHADRELCLHCGADLASGDALPSLADHAVARTDPDDATRGSARRLLVAWLLSILAVLGVVGAVVLGLYLAGVGPFADPLAPLDPVAFPQEAYADEPELLTLESIASVTTRQPEGARTFTPEHLVDGDPETAWHGDPSALPDGVTEKIDVLLDRPSWVHTVVLGNGDQTDPEVYQDTARVARAVLHLDGGIAYEIVLLDLGLEPQAVELPMPMLTTAVRLELLDLIGSEAVVPALSRVELRGWVAGSEDAALAEERADERPAAGPITLTMGR